MMNVESASPTPRSRPGVPPGQLRRLERFAPHPLRADARELLRQGVDAREVAEALSLPWGYIRRWAIEIGMPPPDQREPALERRRQGEALLLKGRRPKEVMATLGVCSSAVRAWARRLGLPPLVGLPPRHPGRDRAEAMLRAGAPVKATAAAVGAPVDTVYHWRCQLAWRDGGPAKEGRPTHPRRAVAERMFRRGQTTRQVARAVEIAASTAWTWRCQLGVSP